MLFNISLSLNRNIVNPAFLSAVSFFSSLAITSSNYA
jgi:hypothetical protein